MRLGHLKRVFLALLMLAVASVWQAAPSFAAQPCDVNVGAMAANHAQTDGHCKTVLGTCAATTVCCQISPNLLEPQNGIAAPIDWDRVAYLSAAPTLAGLRLAPALHPPSVRV
jgi:hypothetical protein